MKQSDKLQPDNSKTQISLAKIGLVSAIGVALISVLGTVLSAYFSSQAAQAPILVPIQATQTADARLAFTMSEPESMPSLSTGDMEQALTAANITLSTGSVDDIARVRGYLAESGSAYQHLALNSLEVMAGLRFKQAAYLDLIDKWYTTLVGEAHYLTAEGLLDAEKLKEAMLLGHNEYYGDSATSFDQIVEARP